MNERRAEARRVRDRERRKRLVDRQFVVGGRDGRERGRARGDDDRVYNSRSAVTTGSRAARIAGSMPPSNPMIIA